MLKKAETGISFVQILRLTFVIFSLYLLGDVFNRWDGFKYYSTLSEFLPSVALITVLWSILAAFAALITWLSLRISESFFHRIGLKIKVEHLLILICFIMLFGVIIWKNKQLILSHYDSTMQLRGIVFVCTVLLAAFLTWLSRNKAVRLVQIIQTRITPLVWLFGIWLILSIPVVGYCTFGKSSDNEQHKLNRSVVNNNNRPNIILVTFDALTARNMSAYGYHKLTTPFIDRWAKKASLFTRLEAESLITTPTAASLMTGKRLWTHQTYH
ncbi:MAG: sulfatase-like hydrolase/transferase, partial [Promethearchaeota archaeon]